MEKDARCECGHAYYQHYEGLGSGCVGKQAGFLCRCLGFTRNKNEVTAAQAAMLCMAREALAELRAEVFSVKKFGEAALKIGEQALKKMDIALSSSPPCVHAEQLCRAVNLLRRGYCSTVTEEELEGILPDTAIPCPHAAKLARLEIFIEERLRHCVADQRGAYLDVQSRLAGQK